MAAGSADIEETTEFRPRFGQDGLIPAIVTDAGSGKVVMFAWMNAEALDRSLESRVAHYWSRSRQQLWRKGETSGNVQNIVEIRIDCDQDALWLTVETAGDGVNCHTGREGCFYRRLERSADGTVRLLFD